MVRAQFFTYAAFKTGFTAFGGIATGAKTTTVVYSLATAFAPFILVATFPDSSGVEVNLGYVATPGSLTPPTLLTDFPKAIEVDGIFDL